MQCSGRDTPDLGLIDFGGPPDEQADEQGEPGAHGIALRGPQLPHHQAEHGAVHQHVRRLTIRAQRLYENWC